MTTSKEQTLALLHRRPAVHQLCVGSFIQAPFELGEDVIAVPLRALGFAAEVAYLAEYTVQIVGAEVEVEVVKALMNQTKDAQSVTALCLPMTIDAPPEDLEASANDRLERARRILSWISSRDVEPIGNVVVTLDKAHFRPIPPPYRNRIFFFGIGGTKENYQQTILAMSKRACSDERFAFALALYHDALKEGNALFKIARMFNVLEALAYKLKTSAGSRRAVKAMLGVVEGAMVEMKYEEISYRFDCIEIAGRIRDKLFHGVGFSESDLIMEARPVFKLLNDHPEDVASIVAEYCELELNRWALGTSKGQT